MAVAIQELEHSEEVLIEKLQPETQTEEPKTAKISQLLGPRTLSERMAAHGRSVTIDRTFLTEPVTLTTSHSFDQLDFALKSRF